MPPANQAPVSSDRRSAVAAHSQRLALVLELLALLALLSGLFPLAAASPLWWLRLGDAVVSLAPVVLLALILLRFASLYLSPGDNEGLVLHRRRTIQLASRWAIGYGLLVPLQLFAYGWLWIDSGTQLNGQLSQATSQFAVVRTRLDGAASEPDLQRILASLSPGLLPPLAPGTLPQQKAQLTEALEFSRSRLQANLSSQRTATLVNAIPGTLRVVLAAAIVSAFMLTLRRSLR